MTLPPSFFSELPADIAETEQASPPLQFVFVKIPVAAHVPDRSRLHEEKIDLALRAKACGSVSGWGSSLGDAWAYGSSVVEFHRIDIEATDLSLSRLVLQQLLPTLGVPAGTEIHYKLGERELADIYGKAGWRLEQVLSDSPPG
jgi:hypothetical protein